jgi:hypothetical protein
MKTNTKIALIAFWSLSGLALSAQTDSVRVQQESTTTSTTQTEVQGTIPAEPAAPPAAPAPAPAPAATQVDDDSADEPLRRGEIGVRYMPTFSRLEIRDAGGDAIQGTMSMTHGWGVMGAFNFSRHVGLQAEVNYHEINQKYKDQGLNRQVRVSYLNIPVLLSLNTNKEAPVNVNFVLGPQFGFNIGADIDGDESGNADQVQATVGVKSGDVGAAYGAGLEFALNDAHTVRLDVGFRGYYGLVDMSAGQSSNNPDTYNVLVKATRKAYSGYLGIAFLF